MKLRAGWNIRISSMGGNLVIIQMESIFTVEVSTTIQYVHLYFTTKLWNWQQMHLFISVKIGEKWIYLQIKFCFACIHFCTELQFGKHVNGNGFTRLCWLNIILFKHKLSLCFISHHILKTWRSGCTGPWILKCQLKMEVRGQHGTPTIFLPEKELLDRRLDGSQH